MADQQYEKLTVAKLRETFKERGIPATGLTKKQQLIDRLHEVDAESQTAGEHTAEKVAEPATEVTEDREAAQQSLAEPEAAGEQPGEARVEPAADESKDASAEEAVVHREEAESAPPAEVSPIVQATSEPQDPAPAIPEPQPTLDQSDTKSPSPKAAEEDSRKRKRRSPTPPVDEEAVQKRLKQEREADATAPAAAPAVTDEKMEDAFPDPPTGGDVVAEDVVQPEADTHMEDAPATKTEAAVEAKESLPEQQEKAAEAAVAAEESAEQALPPDQKQANGDARRDARFRNLSATFDKDKALSPDAMDLDDEERDVEPSRHAATAALYIRNLKRPIREGQLRDHLKQLAAPPAAPAPDVEEIDVQIYLDSMRTHAFALLPSISHATRVRTKLHNVIWPKEREREPLLVDFIREDQYDDFAREEEAAVNAGGARPSTMKRFEVAYVTDGEGETKAELRQQGAGVGMPGAPTGPRRPSVANVEPPSSRKRKAPDLPDDTPSFGALGKMFKSTEAKPKLYFQPVPTKLVDERLDELKRQSSRRLLSGEVGGGSGLPDSRRYTFEEKGSMEGRHITEDGRGYNAYMGSARLCDNGPEFGLKVPLDLRRRGGGFRGGRGRGR